MYGLTNNFAFEVIIQTDGYGTKVGLKVRRYFKDVTRETDSFAFEVWVILGLESSRSDGWVDEIGLSGPKD